MNAIAIVLHLLSAVIWVGGMFFAYMVLRPAAASALQPPERLTMWVQTFKRFFPWVWICVVLLPATGYWLVFEVYDGLSSAPKYVNIMQGLGIVMILLYLHVYFAPFRRLCKAVDQAESGRLGCRWQAAGNHTHAGCDQYESGVDCYRHCRCRALRSALLAQVLK